MLDSLLVLPLVVLLLIVDTEVMEALDGNGSLVRPKRFEVPWTGSGASLDVDLDAPESEELVFSEPLSFPAGLCPDVGVGVEGDRPCLVEDGDRDGRGIGACLAVMDVGLKLRLGGALRDVGLALGVGDGVVGEFCAARGCDLV